MPRKSFKVLVWDATYARLPWDVVYLANLKDDDGDACDGLCDYDNKIIYVDSAITSRRKVLDTLLHEGNHAAAGRCVSEDTIKHMEQNYQSLREGFRNG